MPQTSIRPFLNPKPYTLNVRRYHATDLNSTIPKPETLNPQRETLPCHRPQFDHSGYWIIPDTSHHAVFPSLKCRPSRFPVRFEAAHARGDLKRRMHVARFEAAHARGSI
jgi:hypothetical protein